LKRVENTVDAIIDITYTKALDEIHTTFDLTHEGKSIHSVVLYQE